MRINTKLAKAKWITYPDDKDIQIKIRPFPMSKGMWTGDESNLMEFGWKRFNYCVMDWKGLEEENGKKLTCNEKNKQFIFDYLQPLMVWITKQIVSSFDDIVVEKKT